MSTWCITSDGMNAYLYGPGNVRLTLKAFDPARVERVDTLPESILGSLFQESLRYPVLDAEPQYWLFLGEHCRWELNDEDAETLYRFLLQPELAEEDT